MCWFNIYDKDYCEKYVKQSKTLLGLRIYRERWEMIQKYLTSGTLLDYGSGPGSFNKEGPASFEKYNYDINPECGFLSYPNKEWDAVTMWDSIEHIPDYYEVIKNLNPKWLFICTPNLENVTRGVADWKHYRPKEHIYYFDKYSLHVILESLGYQIVETNFAEGAIRDKYNPEAILTVVARKV